MCVIACKYFKDIGWVASKNRDRNYKPIIHIKQSLKNNIERIFIWDEITRWTEGLNEHGISILSSSLAVKRDETEGRINRKKMNTRYYCFDGKIVREALFEKNIEKTLEICIERGLPGNTVIFDEENLYLLEGALKIIGNKKEYHYKTQKIPKEECLVRTNHGILIPWAGYIDPPENLKKENPEKYEIQKLKRLSSLIRYDKTCEDIEKVENYNNMFDCISRCDDKENFNLNPLRRTDKRGSDILVTTGQIMLVPKERTLYYRPVWCNINFKFEKLDSPKTKTFFQIISSRKLLGESFKDFANLN